MRTYVVQPGDSPASIAAKSEHAGCPRCARDLVLSPGNAHKKRVVHPNGFVSWESLHVGERLELPEKWFSGELDRMPQSYFDSLPRHDGVTPGVGQSPLDVIGSAKAAVAAIAADPNYCVSVSQPGSPVNTAVHDFKVAWNADNPDFPVPIGTSRYEPSTANALSLALGKKPSPPGCSAAGVPVSAPVPQPFPAPIEKKGLSTGAVVGIGFVAATVVGGITYAATKRRRRRS